MLRLTAAAGALGLVALVDDAMQQLALEVVGSRYPWLRERSTAARLTAVEATVHALGATSPLPPSRALRRGLAMSFPKRPNRLHSMAALRKREVHTAQQSLLLPAVLALDQHKRLSTPTLRVTQTAKGLAGGEIVELSDPQRQRRDV